MKITKDGRYKFEKAEIWNADRTAARFLYKLVKKFRKEARHSCPPEPGSIKEWHKLLRKMEWSFKERIRQKHYPDIRKYDDNEKYAKALKKYEAKIQKGVDLFAKYLPDLWN